MPDFKDHRQFNRTEPERLIFSRAAEPGTELKSDRKGDGIQDNTTGRSWISGWNFAARNHNPKRSCSKIRILVLCMALLYRVFCWDSKYEKIEFRQTKLNRTPGAG